MPSELAQIVDDYVEATNAWQPGGASGRGFHEHDGELGERTEGAIEERQRAVRGFLDRLRRVEAGQLKGDERYDADLLTRRLSWELTEHEHVRSWQRNPGSYLGSIAGACNGLVIRDFAPLDERIASLAARLEAAPALLEQGKANLRDPSRYHIETAIEQAAGMRALFERDLPAAAAGAGDAALRQRFDAANSAALAAVDAYGAWLKTDLLPKATDDFAWGADTMQRLLSETDSIDEPIDVLIKRGEEDLRAHQQTLRRRSSEDRREGDTGGGRGRRLEGPRRAGRS